MRYSEQRKRSVLAKLSPPHNRTIKEVSEEEGLSPATLYSWCRQARQRGLLFPDAGSPVEGWTARDKLAAVLETASMNEAERAEYCRKRGLYGQQLATWRKASETANDWAVERRQQQRTADTEVRRRVQELELELTRKNAALAETAALLTSSKKDRAIWGEGEDA